MKKTLATKNTNTQKSIRAPQQSNNITATAFKIASQWVQNELAKNNLPEIKNVVSDLIRENIQRKTLASSAEDYVFTVLDPPYKPEYPTSPQKLLITIVSVFIVFLLNVSIIFFKFFKKNH